MILLLIALPLLFGCGGKGKEIKKIEGDPEILYKQGLARFNKRDYTEALKKFEDLKSNFPDSPPYTLWAELKIGDCHFFKKEYVEAIAAYEEFKKIHPSHDEIPYVQYQIGMSYFNQMYTLDRDQTPTKKALSSFEYLIANYPPSLFTEKAREKIGVCIKRLADHEFYIGNFYYKHGKYQAAASRFEGLLEKYPKNPGEDKTLYLLGKSCLELDQREKARGALARIVNEYPNSSHTKEAQMILNQAISGAKDSSDKTKTKESKKKGEIAETEPGWVALIRYEEEEKKPVSLREEKKIELKKEEGKWVPPPIRSESDKPIPPKEEKKEMISPKATESIQEGQSQPLPPPLDTKPGEPIQAREPMKEDQAQIPPSPPKNP